MDMGLKDKVVLITGGGGGIARGIERAFATEGAKFILTDLFPGGLEAAKEELERDFGSEVFTTFFYMKHAYPYLKETAGSVINFASGAGIGGNPGQSSYAAAKEGIRGMSRVAASEWGPDNINVNIVCPIVMTKALEEWREREPEMYEKNVKAIPLGRFGDAEKDVGRVCVFLASPDASFVTGDTIMVQGGSGMKP